MGSRYKTIGIWLVVLGLSITAFTAGELLRELHGRPLIKGMPALEASALIKLTPESSPVAIDSTKPGTSDQRELVSTVVRLLKAHYVEPITPEKETAMARGAVRGMMESLNDPDSRFLDPTERKLLDDAGAGRFHGIGAILALKKEHNADLDITKLIVITPMPGSPADKAGVKPGDSITHVDGKWIISHDPFKEPEFDKLRKAVRNKDTDALTFQKDYEARVKRLKDGVSILDALESVTSKTSGDIGITVERAGESAPIDLKLRCRNITVDPVSEQSVNHGIAYIRVTQFSRTAPAQFALLLAHVQAQKAKALVLDLRNNPGGLLDSAAIMISKITGGGLVGSVQTNADRRAIKQPIAHKLGIPVVVLMNGGTASVAELAAGSLREAGGATLVGVKTFGDGTIQTPLLLKDGSAAILTTGKMLTAKGVDFTGKGLSPDKEIPDGTAGSDIQREEAVKLLLAKIGKA